MCLFRSQAGSLAVGVAVTFRDALARFPKGRGLEAPPTPGSGRTSFSAQKQREPSGRRQPDSAHPRLRRAHWLEPW